MIDWCGRWEEERDYSVYPKEKWCDMDYMANWIKGTGYIPKTSLENLIIMIFMGYEEELKEYNKEFYTDITESENGLMVSIEDVSCYVSDCGGLSEFDFYY